MAVNKHEPKPVKNGNRATWEIVAEEYDRDSTFIYKKEVLKDFHDRDMFGREKHGTPLQCDNGRNSLEDSKQEALDLIVYLENSVLEETNPMKRENIKSILQLAITLYENTVIISKQ